MSSTLIAQPTRPVSEPAPSRRWLARAAFYIHLWLGVLATIALIAISITGILLNHKRGLGLMPDVPYEPTAAFSEAISLERMALAALEAAPESAKPNWNSGDPVRLDLIDRMDVRPRDGFVKVRLRDKASMEMTVDIASGQVVHIGRRGDVFLEKLHSGEAFGARLLILSDIAAVCLVLTLITGYWLWLVPKMSRGIKQLEGVERA
ncbi:MAG: PepSY-associated TM helix domain-containing protein [Longimicrobiales bacterium]